MGTRKLLIWKSVETHNCLIGGNNKLKTATWRECFIPSPVKNLSIKLRLVLQITIPLRYFNTLFFSDILYLFSTVRRQVKRENSEEADTHARDDDVHSVEEGLASHRDVECNVQVRLITARVEPFVSITETYTK